MFHRRYQRLTQLTLREKWRVARALSSFEPDLPERVAWAEAFLVAELVGATPPPIPGISVEGALWGQANPKLWESNTRTLVKIYFERGIRALTAAQEREHAPANAIKLAEYYMYLERYTEAVELLKNAVASAPSDIRPIYALATIYRILGRAREDEAEQIFGDRVPQHGLLLSTPSIEDACSQLGLTAQVARQLAAEHFAQVLAMNVHPDERGTVQESLRVVQQMLQATAPILQQSTLRPEEDALSPETVEAAAQKYLESLDWTPELGGFLMYAEALGHSTLMAFHKSSLLKTARGQYTAHALVRDAFMYGLGAGDRLARIGKFEETDARRHDIARWAEETDAELLQRGARAYCDDLAHEQQNAGRKLTALLDKELQRDAMAAHFLRSEETKYEALLRSAGGGESKAEAHQAVEQAGSLWLRVFTAGMLVGNTGTEDGAWPTSVVSANPG